MKNVFNKKEIKSKIKKKFLPVSKDVSVTVGNKRTDGIEINNINKGNMYNAGDDKDTIVKNLKSFLNEDKKLSLQENNLVMGHVAVTKSRIFVRFYEKINDIRIFGARTKAVFDRQEKKLRTIKRTIYWDSIDTDSGYFNVKTPKINLKEAVKKYLQSQSSTDTDISEDFSELIYFYDVDSKDFRLAWYFYIVGKGRNDDVIIDSETGRLLQKRKAAVSDDYIVEAIAKGNYWDELHAYIAYDASPTVTNTAINYLDFELTTDSGSETANSGSDGLAEFLPKEGQDDVTLESKLTSPQVKVVNNQEEDDEDEDYYGSENWDLTDNVTKEFTISSSHDMETSLFVHMSLMAEFFTDTFDFQWEGPVWGEQMKGIANSNHEGDWEETCTSCAEATGPLGMEIGTGNHHPGSVYHEYGHNVIYCLFGGYIKGGLNNYSEGYAMDEGFADFVSCTYRNDSKRYAQNRDLKNNYRYEDHYNLINDPGEGYGLYNGKYNWEGHYGCQIIGGALWELRGRRFTSSEVDQLWWEALNDLEGVEEDTERIFSKFAEFMVSNADAGKKYAIHTAFNAIHGITMPESASPTIGSRAFSLKDGDDVILWIDSNDNFIIIGNLLENETGSPSSGDFILKHNGTLAAWIDHTDHNLHIKGIVLAGETDFSQGAMENAFVFKKNGTAVAYLKDDGDLHVKTYFVSNGLTP